MFNQFEDMIITKIVQQLESHGVTVDPQTLKNVVTNSPQIIAQIETILATSDNNEKIAKITALLQSAESSTGNQTK